MRKGKTGAQNKLANTRGVRESEEVDHLEDCYQTRGNDQEYKKLIAGQRELRPLLTFTSKWILPSTCEPKVTYNSEIGVSDLQLLADFLAPKHLQSTPSINFSNPAPTSTSTTKSDNRLPTTTSPQTCRIPDPWKTTPTQDVPYSQ